MGSLVEANSTVGCMTKTGGSSSHVCHRKHHILIRGSERCCDPRSKKLTSITDVIPFSERISILVFSDESMMSSSSAVGSTRSAQHPLRKRAVSSVLCRESSSSRAEDLCTRTFARLGCTNLHCLRLASYGKISPSVGLPQQKRLHNLSGKRPMQSIFTCHCFLGCPGPRCEERPRPAPESARTDMNLSTYSTPQHTNLL